MNRRSFLARMGLGSVAILLGTRTEWHPEPGLADAGSEEIEIRVYGGGSLRDHALLARRTVRVRPVTTSEGIVYYGPRDLTIVLHGPIAVTAVVCSTPRAFRFLRDECNLPVLSARAARGETITVAMPEVLMSVG